MGFSCIVILDHLECIDWIHIVLQHIMHRSAVSRFFLSLFNLFNICPFKAQHRVTNIIGSREMFTIKTLFHDCALYSLYIPLHRILLIVALEYFVLFATPCMISSTNNFVYLLVRESIKFWAHKLTMRLRVTNHNFELSIALWNLFGKRSICLSLR